MICCYYYFVTKFCFNIATTIPPPSPRLTTPEISAWGPGRDRQVTSVHGWRSTLSSWEKEPPRLKKKRKKEKEKKRAQLCTNNTNANSLDAWRVRGWSLWSGLWRRCRQSSPVTSSLFAAVTTRIAQIVTRRRSCQFSGGPFCSSPLEAVATKRTKELTHAWERERENSNSKTLFYKDCSLGSVKNVTTSPC